jgi:CRISPR system Cascade subunit CasD
MSTENGYLALLLDGPMQSWGFASRFQRRTTGLYPTKSGVIGLICAAMGLAKGLETESQMLPRLRDLRMQAVALPRPKPDVRQPQPGRRSDWLEPRRIEDYHTVGGGFDPETQPYSVPWTASGHPDKDATVSKREYLFDARFGVILVGDSDLLSHVAEALRNPAWGTWLGRKSCVPAAPVLAGGPFGSYTESWKALLGKAELPLEIPYAVFGSVEEVASDHGYVSIPDQPVSFGDGRSSGPDKRQFAVRRIKMVPGRSIQNRQSKI